MSNQYYPCQTVTNIMQKTVFVTLFFLAHAFKHVCVRAALTQVTH